MPGSDAGAADATTAVVATAAGAGDFAATEAALGRAAAATAAVVAVADGRGAGETGGGDASAACAVAVAFGVGARDGEGDGDATDDGFADAAAGEGVAACGVAAGLAVAGRSVASGANVAGATVGVGDGEGIGEIFVATSWRVVTWRRASDKPAPITSPRMTMPIRKGTSGNDESFGCCGGRRERRGGVSFIASRFRFAHPASMRGLAIPARSRTTFEKMHSQRKRSRGS
jgi:hypothetical protein